MTPQQRDADIHRMATYRTPWQIAVLWHLPVAKVRLILHRRRFTLDMAAVLREAQPSLGAYLNGGTDAQ